MRRGVFIPIALLATTLREGDVSGARDARERAGVPAADGVPGKKRLSAFGASGNVCSTVPSFMSTSSGMGAGELGMCSGEDDMAR